MTFFRCFTVLALLTSLILSGCAHKRGGHHRAHHHRHGGYGYCPPDPCCCPTTPCCEP